MIGVDMKFNNGTYEILSNWIENGTPDIREGALWLVATLASIENTGGLRGNCVVNSYPIQVWHLQEKPCNVLYRDRIQSFLRLKLTIDRAIDGNHDWAQLGTSILYEPDGP